MDSSTQFLLTATLILLILFILFIGIQLTLIYYEFKSILKRVNALIDGFERVGSNLGSGMNGFLGFFSSIKAFLKKIERAGKRRQ